MEHIVAMEHTSAVAKQLRAASGAIWSALPQKAAALPGLLWVPAMSTGT